MTTASIQEKAKRFEEVNEEHAEKSSILPMSQYVGKPPKNPDDRFDRRVVPQLSDISFEEDSEEDFEDVKNIKRQPMTVLTEANLRNILTGETTKLNIEHHYWLKDNFLCKLGRLAPNLKILSLKRLAISN